MVFSIKLGRLQKKSPSTTFSAEMGSYIKEREIDGGSQM